MIPRRSDRVVVVVAPVGRAFGRRLPLPLPGFGR